MSEQPRPASGQSRREMRKTIIRLQLELQRQQIRQESRQLLQPLQHARNISQTARRLLRGNTPLLAGAGGAVLLGLLAGRKRSWVRLLRIGIALAPLLLNLRKAKTPSEPPPAPTTHL